MSPVKLVACSSILVEFSLLACLLFAFAILVSWHLLSRLSFGDSLVVLGTYCNLPGGHFGNLHILTLKWLSS